MLGMRGAFIISLLDFLGVRVTCGLVLHFISKANTVFPKMSNINEIKSLGNKFDFILRFNFLAFSLKSCP